MNLCITYFFHSTVTFAWVQISPGVYLIKYKQMKIKVKMYLNSDVGLHRYIRGDEVCEN